ncbi:hypothetical protein Tco_0212153 [Tanacetum coccineum]
MADFVPLTRLRCAASISHHGLCQRRKSQLDKHTHQGVEEAKPNLEAKKRKNNSNLRAGVVKRLWSLMFEAQILLTRLRVAKEVVDETTGVAHVVLLEKDITPKDRKQCKKMTKPDTEWKSCKGQGQSKAKDQISQVKVNSTNQQSKPEPDHRDNFELKHDTSTMKFPERLENVIKLMLFPFPSRVGLPDWLEKERPRSIQHGMKLDRFNDLLRACPHHGFSELRQLDTFYNALNSNDQDSLNSAAGVSSSTSTPGISPDVAELKDMVKALLLDKKSQAPTPVKAVEESCVTCGGAHSYQNCPPPMQRLFVTIFKSLGTLPSNTVTNPKEDLKGITTRSGVAYKGPTIPTTSSPKVVERDIEVTKDTMPPTNNEGTEDVQPPVFHVKNHKPISEPVVAPVSALMPNPRISIPYPSRRNDERKHEKANDQIEKFFTKSFKI